MDHISVVIGAFEGNIGVQRADEIEREVFDHLVAAHDGPILRAKTTFAPGFKLIQMDPIVAPTQLPDDVGGSVRRTVIQN